MKIYDNWSHFVSAREPYFSDDYVKKVFRELEEEASHSPSSYSDFVRRSILSEIVSTIANSEGNPDELAVVDCGVYMGHFAVAVDILLKACGVSPKLVLIEANPRLVDPIRENLDYYGIGGYELIGSGLAPAGSGKVTLHIRKGGQIGGSLRDPGGNKAAYEDVEIDTVSLNGYLEGSRRSIVKLDLEGIEPQIFDDLDAANLDNYFIIEFAPWQTELSCRSGSYGEFLLEHFVPFNLKNWLRAQDKGAPERIEDLDALRNVLSNDRESNVDVLLVPRSLETAGRFFS